MTKQMNDIMVGVIVDETMVYSLQEISYTCGVSVAVIEEMIEQGVVEPKKITAGEKQFDPSAVRRLKIALRLQKDLEVNLPGAALALDLLNELEELRTHINILEKHYKIK